MHVFPVIKQHDVRVADIGTKQAIIFIGVRVSIFTFRLHRFI